MREVMPVEVLSHEAGPRPVADSLVKLAKGVAGASVGCTSSMTSSMVTSGGWHHHLLSQQTHHPEPCQSFHLLLTTSAVI